jgi:hypothetical protein
MCLTTEALLIFLNLLPPEIIEAGGDRITIHAEAGDAIWIAQGDKWCTNAPQIEASLRLNRARAN